MKMTERERLIELLMQGAFNCSRSKWRAVFIADYLLANGVRVPPVVVGTTVSACDNIEVIGNIHDDPELLG